MTAFFNGAEGDVAAANLLPGPTTLGAAKFLMLFNGLTSAQRTSILALLKSFQRD